MKVEKREFWYKGYKIYKWKEDDYRIWNRNCLFMGSCKSYHQAIIKIDKIEKNGGSRIWN